MQINPGLEAMFETGVDEMSWDDTVSTALIIFSFVSFKYLSIFPRKTIVWVVPTNGLLSKMC